MMRKIGIIGSLNTEILFGRFVDFPGWGKQAFGNSLKIEAAGSALRVAFPLVELGLKSYVMGIIGNDIFGERILEKMSDCGLPRNLVRITETKPTGMCISIVKDDGERTLFSYLGALEDLKVSHLIAMEDVLKKGDYLLLTGYFVLPGLRETELINFFERMRKRGIRVLFDPGWDPENWIKGGRVEIISLLREVDIFLPNLEEASAISGKEDIEEIFKEISRYGPKLVFLKIGKSGSAAYTEDTIYRKEAFPVQAKDTTAAGETFNGGVIFGLMKGWSKERILEFSNALVSLAISDPEGRYPGLDEVMKLINRNKKQNNEQQTNSSVT